MRQQKITLNLTIFDSVDELPADDQMLMSHAVTAREDAYAPYSDFKVGAAVLLMNNAVITGNNQENASYPSGLCAERVAIFQAAAHYPGIPFKAIAISASSGHYEVLRPAAPCGDCRQAISEYEQRYESPIELIMMGVSGEVFKCCSMAEMLPLAFGKSFL